MSKPDRPPLPPINFNALAKELQHMAKQLLDEWLTGGAVRGIEYKAHSPWRDEKTASFSIRLSGEKAGQWADFGGDKRGKDLIDLYAALNNLDNGQAAVQLARQLGLEDVAGVVRAAGGAAPPPRPPPVKAPAPPPREPEGWKTMIPVPANAPPATFKHQYRKPEDLEHLATYRVDGHLMGYVVRFRTSDGGKETLPHTWCTSQKDAGSKWNWRQWDEPRPLYYPGGVSPARHAEVGKPKPTIIVVEGEKKADILQALLDEFCPGIYIVVGWPGGCKAWKKALWDWLAGFDVLLWPDCDGKRQALTKEEREAYPDELARQVFQQSKPLLPAEKQPGMQAMLGIGAHLQTLQCTVQMLPIPAPGEVVDGWDCADAIVTDGWDIERLLAFFGRAQPLQTPETPEPEAGVAGGGGKGKKRGRPAVADDPDKPDDEFQEYLDFVCGQLGIKIHELGITRKLLIVALRRAPALKNCLGFNELLGAPYAKDPWPWRDEGGPLGDNDDLRLGDYLSARYKLKAASRAALAEAIETVADERRYHPIRDWLAGLKHDGVTRIDKWLMYVTGKDPAKLKPGQRRYFELVGRFMVMGLVARVMDPGCKFDYSPVFEGLTGMGKSTLVKELVGREYFSDTHFDIGNGKDGMEQLEGLWAYELSEMTAFRRADNEQVKQFFSSQVDRFRGAYGKFVQKHPRQCLIICTTNKRQYLYDLTGNRRFWPIWIDALIKLAWLRKFRGELFAEAYALYQKGERYTPTPEEEKEFFEPEQRKRLAETAVQSKLYHLLTREGAAHSEGKLSAELTQLTSFVTLDRLVEVLGTDAAKSSTLLESQIRGWLESHGWRYARESTGQRRYGFKQPKEWPPKITDSDDEDERPPEDAPPGPEAVPPAQGESYGGDDDAPF
jgi:putative DNA primase/helicase